MRPVPVVLRRLAFWPHSYDLIFAEGYPHCAQAERVVLSNTDLETELKLTLVLLVEGAVPTAPAEGVRLGVSLTAKRPNQKLKH